jgi:hypothetical protein
MQRALAGLAKLTIAGCRTTWQGAGGLWAEVNRRDQIFLQQSHRTAIILDTRVLLCIVLHKEIICAFSQ